jgi:hypothetical protein
MSFDYQLNTILFMLFFSLMAFSFLFMLQFAGGEQTNLIVIELKDSISVSEGFRS